MDCWQWPLDHLSYYRLSELCMRDDDEEKIFDAIKRNDIETLKKLLPNPRGRRLGSKSIPILSVAILQGFSNMIKFLIGSGCGGSQDIDKNGNTVLHLLVSENMIADDTDEDTQQHPLDEKDRLDIVDTLLASYSNPVEVVFLCVNEMKMTPFLLACGLGSNAMVSRFLSMLENNSISIPIDKFIGYKGNNLIHFLVDKPVDELSSVKETFLLFGKLLFCRQLIDAKNEYDTTSLFQFLDYFSDDEPKDAIADLAKIFFEHGSSPYTLSRGWAYLDVAISHGNIFLVEMLLRAGCRNACYEEDVIYYVLHYQWHKSKPISIRMIELFLAFGYNLGKDRFFSQPSFTALPEDDNRNDIVNALQELRQSNKLLSLQRQCRNTIRRHLQVKADEVIGNLTCIPDRIKSFLLLENEPSLLEISE